MNLNQVTLPSLDLSRTIAFYQLLGLELIVDSAPRYARLACPGGGSTLSLHQAESTFEGEGISIYFECADLDRRVSALEAAGLVFETKVTEQRWLWREAWLRDPDGHRICLYWAGKNRLDPPWRVGGKDAQSSSINSAAESE